MVTNGWRQMVSSWPGGCGSKYAWSGKTFSENKAELGELPADLQSAVELFHSAAVSRRALGITISNPPGIENRTGHSPGQRSAAKSRSCILLRRPRNNESHNLRR